MDMVFGKKLSDDGVTMVKLNMHYQSELPDILYLSKNLSA